MSRYPFICLLFGFTILAPAQEKRDAQPVRVYIDCGYCDEDYIRTELTWVNYVRDRLLADVHVLVTTQSTGSGGREYTFSFIGQNAAAGMNDTLRANTKESDSEETIRNVILHTLKLGLLRYAARTPVAEHLAISFNKPEGETVTAVDSWDNWVFRTSINGNINGEKSSTSMWLSGGFSAGRITHDWKINASIDLNYNQNDFTFDEQTPTGTVSRTVTSLSRGQYLSSLIARSIDDHWSVGAYASLSTSTYSNTRLSVRFTPALEYNIFPYSQSTRKELRIIYEISYNPVRYFEETIYDHTSETLFSHNLSSTLKLREPWGSVSTTLEGMHYLHDIKKRRLRLSVDLSLNLVEGLSFNVSGSVSKINDQLFLAKKGATPEEVLLRQTQLATSYYYWSYFGLSYTFGAIYNNIVNPRFGS